jgi:hypothetical protein
MPDSVPHAEVVWTWGSILRLALTTGFFTAALNQGFAWLKETMQRRGKDRRAGKVLALSLVKVLTSYAQECNVRARVNRYAESEGYRQSKMPELPPYQDPDPGWEVLPSGIAAGLMDFRIQVDDAARRVDETEEFVGAPEAIDSATYLYVDLGFKAWQLSERLRRHYCFGRYSGQAAFVDELKSHYRKGNPVFRKFWRSLPVYRLRGRVRRQFSRLRLWIAGVLWLR